MKKIMLIAGVPSALFRRVEAQGENECGPKQVKMQMVGQAVVASCLLD